MYDQTIHKETWYACVFFWFLHILKFKYGIDVLLPSKDTKIKYAWILKFVGYLKFLWVLLTWGSVTSTMYATCTQKMRSKLFLNFIVLSASITKWELKEWEFYGLGIKNLSTYYKKLAQDGRITREEIDAINKKKGYWHHIMYHRWPDIVYDSYGAFQYHLPFENLQYWVKTGSAYDTARSLDINDDATEKTLNFLKRMRNKENIKLSDFLKEDQEYIMRAGRIFKKDFSALSV